MNIGGKDFWTEGKTYIMGILNVTPDSFSDGGKWNSVDSALAHAEQMIAEGADILDIGGESTRPGFAPVSSEEEISRVIPVISAIKERFDIPLSLDTSKSTVASAGIAAGADMINDVWGLKKDPQMAETIANAGIPCCLMHNRDFGDYNDFIADLLNDLRKTLQIAERAGIRQDQIILDPGIGFAKTYEQNLEILRRIDILRELECPLLLGASRKSFIGQTLNLPSDQRIEGTIAASVYAALHGCMFVRVHDVKENARAIRMTEAILHEE